MHTSSKYRDFLAFLNHVREEFYSHCELSYAYINRMTHLYSKSLLWSNYLRNYKLFIKTGTIRWRMIHIKTSSISASVMFGAPAGMWLVILPPHGVSVVQPRKVRGKSELNCDCNFLHHHSEAVHQREHKGLTGWKLPAYLQLWQKKKAGDSGALFLTLECDFGNGIQFPSLAENRCSRQLFFCPITRLADWKWSQHLLAFLSGWERNTNTVLKHKCFTQELKMMTDLPQIQLKEKHSKNSLLFSSILLHMCTTF